MSHVINVTQSNFQAEVIDSDLPVVIDFYATWCPPCRRLAPMLDQLAREFAGSVKFVKINSDEEPQMANQYDVQALPTLVFIDGGTHIGQFSGLPDENALRNELAKWIQNKELQDQ